jgi:RNA polymerase sigma-70 factor, ECF subfamily
LPALDDALDEIYRRHAAAVFRRARRLMASDADAQDIMQDVFLSLFERPEQFAGRSTLTTFLYRATTNACLARIRNSKNRQRLLENHPDATATAREPELIALAQLHDALRKMPELLARVAVYAWFDELSHAEIASLVGCSRRHVANLLERIEVWARQQEELSCC